MTVVNPPPRLCLRPICWQISLEKYGIQHLSLQCTVQDLGIWSENIQSGLQSLAPRDMVSYCENVAKQRSKSADTEQTSRKGTKVVWGKITSKISGSSQEDPSTVCRSVRWRWEQKQTSSQLPSRAAWLWSSLLLLSHDMKTNKQKENKLRLRPSCLLHIHKKDSVHIPLKPETDMATRFSTAF